MNPLFPMYIPTKGRAEYRYTITMLQRMNLFFYAVVESQEYDQYLKHVDKKNLLVLDNQYKRNYETLDFLGDSVSYGPGPARNFALEHAKNNGFNWYWVMDDNIRNFYVLHKNCKIRIFNGAFFRAMEHFVLRYSNIAMAGPQYEMFIPRKSVRPLYTLNTRIFSCNLIRTDLKYRWRGRYNEDTILSLDMLTDGLCTVLFNTFLQDKITTQVLPGGNTEEFYKKGTSQKSILLKRTYPSLTRLVIKYGRPHHYINFRTFTQQLVRKPNYNDIIKRQEPIEFKLGSIK